MSEPGFLAVADAFRLGMLDTERSHPKTRELSRWAVEDLPRAIAALQEVDRDALRILGGKLDSLLPLAREVHDTLKRGNRLYLVGCGATGRLSIALEVLARRGLLPGATADNIAAFMAGGDAALIRSIESFEDHPDYGARQLLELGFQDGDLLIASTEGGETPFVIGATEAAADHSSRAPFFLYGNPDSLLEAHVERSRHVLHNPRIRKINLATGPMALAGSTRMQASTVLMAAIGLALRHHPVPGRLIRSFHRWRPRNLSAAARRFLEPFIVAEAATYQQGDFVSYEPGPYGISVLTDTTERSPTFSLTPFERLDRGEPPSRCFLRVRGTADASAAWQRLLDRPPRPLEWGTLCHLTGSAAISAFDFSDSGAKDRKHRCAPGRSFRFRISRTRTGIRWRFRGIDRTLPLSGPPGDLFEHLTLKMLLNMHSTLVMGRLGRYEGNLMTYVSATNFKLTDRAIRYAQEILERQHNWKPAYATVAQHLLRVRATLPANEPVVLRTVEALLPQRAALT